MENNLFYLNGELVRKVNFGKVTRGTIKVYVDGVTEYLPFVAFGKVGTIVSSIHDGTVVCAVCRLHSSSYEKAGKKVYTTDVVIDSINCVDGD